MFHVLCPSCHKSQPLSFRCADCGAPLVQANYQAATAPPLMEQARAPTSLPGDNPYRAPRAAVAAPSPSADVSNDALAGRGARLAAAIIDYLCLIAVAIPGFAGFVYADTTGADAAASGVASLVFMLAVGVLGLMQASYLVRDGQTIGKKLMKIRIVDYVDGEIPPWHRILGLRYIANTALRQIPFYFFVDVFLIFGKDQRCIHDYIAGTKVVEVREAS